MHWWQFNLGRVWELWPPRDRCTVLSWSVLWGRWTKLTPRVASRPSSPLPVPTHSREGIGKETEPNIYQGCSHPVGTEERRSFQKYWSVRGTRFGEEQKKRVPISGSHSLASEDIPTIKECGWPASGSHQKSGRQLNRGQRQGKEDYWNWFIPVRYLCSVEMERNMESNLGSSCFDDR